MAPLHRAAALPCHRCGYDLRAQAAKGICPECAAPVADARRHNAIPARPAWRDSDPRWRRRMIAGTWLLTAVPLLMALDKFGWIQSIPVPTFALFKSGVRSLNDTFLLESYVSLVFCMGSVLLFSKERGRRPSKFDWTRRWGVILSYVLLLLCATRNALLIGLQLTGLAALLHSLPLREQPALTEWVATIAIYLNFYGPSMDVPVWIVQLACAATVVLFACVQLHRALRSSGRKTLAGLLVAVLGVAALVEFVYPVLYLLDRPANISLIDLLYYNGLYFWPELLTSRKMYGHLNLSSDPFLNTIFVGEVIKWAAIFTVALWLSIAQIASWRRGRSWRRAGREGVGSAAGPAV